MVYNLYVIVANIVVSISCGAITMLLAFQLHRDAKAQAFMVFTLLECLAEGTLTVARVISLFSTDRFVPFVYLGFIIYSAYPFVLLRFVAEFFDLWTPGRRRLAHWLLALPVLLFVCALSNNLFSYLVMSEAGSFSYRPTLSLFLVVGIGELCIFYTLVLVIRHALSVRVRAQRQLIFGVILLLVTSLLVPSEILLRTFGALGIFSSTLIITGSVMRNRLFDPLTQVNAKLVRRTRKLRRAMKQNQALLEQTKNADKAKTRFIGYISHEVRGPITNIYTAVQAMVDHSYIYGVELPIPYRDDITRVYRQSNHVKNLIEDLMDLSRIEADALRLSSEVLDPVPVLREVQQNLRPQMRDGVIFQALYGDCLPKVYADKTRLKQILLNIVSNAIKFTEQGTVSLNAYVENSAMRFEVIDTGPGMSDEVLSHLFQPYTQDARNVGNPRQSAGLGLSISKRLVELHGGTIQVSSKSDEGTTIAFTMPLVCKLSTKSVE